jgi:hypothetical protein
VPNFFDSISRSSERVESPKHFSHHCDQNPTPTTDMTAIANNDGLVALRIATNFHRLLANNAATFS